ncbi:MAG: hypothetical protein IJD79_07015 [Clostridia bacterium]|nr:hypothetical protein [Clostridia bacterium]
MKIKQLGALIAVAILSIAVSIGLIFTSSATEGTSDGGADNAVWEITHADGSVTYAYSFGEAFKKISDGDYFKLLPTEYDVYLLDYARIVPSSQVNITIDIRGTTIIAPESGDVDGQIFNISDKYSSRYTVLMENAKIYAAHGGRCAFSVGNTSIINIDGGEAGGIIYAGGALNLTSNYSDPDTYSVMKNIYCFKPTVNMAGMICSRNTSKLKLIDCYAVATKTSGVPLYVRNSGEMILENSHGISLDGGNVLQFVDVSEETKFTLGKGSSLFGNVKDMTDPSLLRILSDTFLEKNYSTNIPDDASVKQISNALTHIIHTSTEVGKDSIEEMSFNYSYAVVGDVTLDDEKSNESVWMLEGESGIKYAKTLSALNANKGLFTKATLLCDLALTEGEVVDITSDFELDLNGKNLTLADGADIGFAFNFGGKGNLTVTLGSSEVNLIGGGFLFATNEGSVSITSSGKLAADTVVEHISSEHTLYVKGGNYLSKFGAGFLSFGDITLEKISAVSLGAGNLVSTRSNISIVESTLVGYSNSYAVSAGKTLKLSSNNHFVGKVEADVIEAGNYNYFERIPVYSEITIVLMGSDYQADLSILSLNESGKIELGSASVTFAFYTEEYILTDTQQNDSVWKLESNDRTVKYTNHIYTPFVEIAETVNFTLLKDVVFEKSITLNLTGDIVIDLGGKNISLSQSFDREKALFEALGVGVLTFRFSGSTLDLSDAVLISAEEIKEISLIGSDGFVSAKTAAVTKGVPITAEGGYYSVTDGALYAAESTVGISSLTAYAPSGAPLIYSDGDIAVNSDVNLISPIGATVISAGERLMVADGVNIYGKTSAKEFYSAGAVSFSFKPDVEYSNMLIVQERANKVVTVKTLENGMITSSSSRMTLSYKTVNITEGLKASMTVSSFATLNVYVPVSVVGSDPDFKIRIVLAGLLYEGDAKDGKTLVVDGKSYVKFTYPYVYPTYYGESTDITLVSGSFSGNKSITLSDYLDRAFAASGSEKQKTVIASYARFSAECSGVKLAEDSPLLPYVKQIKIYSEEESELLFDYFRSIRYEPFSNELRFTPWTSCDYTLKISYKYGDKNLYYTFDSKDGAFAVPVFRFGITSEFSMTFTSDNGSIQSLNIDLYELCDFAEEGSDTRMLLTLYLAYANALFEFNA